MNGTGRPHLIERALELARSGQFERTTQLRQVLKREGYDAVEAHLSGSLAKQIAELCRSSRQGSRQA
jgi:hypothetical protein